MRYIVLDTETTGLSPSDGHRIIEIGCIEIINRKITNNNFHFYLDPERDIDAGAQRVHGITAEFLAGKPKFAEIAAQFLTYIGDATLIIHNASFDLRFLNSEFAKLKGNSRTIAKVGLTDFSFDLLENTNPVIDTLEMARKLHPGQRNNLDSVAKRYKVDISDRALHGALLDSSILAKVYLMMTGGQTTLSLTVENNTDLKQNNAKTAIKRQTFSTEGLLVTLATADELLAHQQYISLLERAGAKSVWNN